MVKTLLSVNFFRNYLNFVIDSLFFFLLNLQMRKGLKKLRKKVYGRFLLINLLLVVIVYTLTEVNANTEHALSIKLPCTVLEGPPGRGYIDPISFTFTAIFGIMLFLQFICMLIHGWSTLNHIVASNKLT